MAAIPIWVKPHVKAFARCYLSQLVKDVNEFIDSNPNYKIIDITFHPKTIPSSDATVSIIYYCDEWDLRPSHHHKFYNSN